MTTQGTQTGERALFQIEGKKLAFKTFEELGMRQKMNDQLMELLNSKTGMFVFTSLPAGGLSTTIDVAMGSVDRFTRNFAAVQDAASSEREILNVPVTTYCGAEGETPATVLPKLIRTYPDVIVVRELVNLETLQILVDQAGGEESERLVLTSLRSKDSVEAIVRLLQFKISPVVLAPVMLGVLNVRLVRKLCENCREAYPPPPGGAQTNGGPGRQNRILSSGRRPSRSIRSIPKWSANNARESATSDAPRSSSCSRSMMELAKCWGRIRSWNCCAPRPARVGIARCRTKDCCWLLAE